MGVNDLPCGCAIEEISWSGELESWGGHGQKAEQGTCPCGEAYHRAYAEQGVFADDGRQVQPAPSEWM